MDPRAQLDLDAFIVEMGRAPIEELTHEHLLELVGRLRLSDELVASRTRFAADGYARNLVCRTPAFELLVLCWRPGQTSTIHDHGEVLNAIRVHRGELTSRIFARRADARGDGGPVELRAEHRVHPSDGLVGVDRGGIHQLADSSPDDLVTVHVYAPPLMELTVFSTERPEVERRPLRYTVADDLE